MNNLLSKIQNCPLEDIKSFVLEALTLIDFNNNDCNLYGFLDDQSMYFIHGFVPLASKFKFSCNSDKCYLLKSTDCYYSFAEYIRDKNVSNIDDFLKYVYDFLESYFGSINRMNDTRDEFFDNLAFQTSATDQEYYEQLEKIDIGDFHGKNIAQSSERALIAQNIMSLFGIDCYMCMGMIQFNGISNEHCFNIVCIDDAPMIIDFALPCQVIVDNNNCGYLPFIAKIDGEELESLLIDGYTRSFKDYLNIYADNGYIKMPTGSTRDYQVLNRGNYKKMVIK